MQSANAIAPLPPDVAAQIKSSTRITSLDGVIVDLLKNSLDASANTVEITVDYRRGGCVVEDDGLGIAPAEFLETGGLGKLHHTSKYLINEEVYGRDGAFLAALSSLSLLAVASKHHLHRSTNSVGFHHAKCISRSLPVPAVQELRRGTRVTVRDLFGNMPVRVKQRGLLFDASNETGKLWDQLRKEVLSLLIAWGKPVTVRIRDAEGAKSILLNGTKAPAHTSLESRTNGGGSDCLKLVLALLAQATLITPESWPSWVPVSASSASVSVKGAISLDPVPSKGVQFISVGIHPILAEHKNELYDLINRLFKNSSFGAQEDVSDISEAEQKRRKQDRRFKQDGPTNRALRGLGKGVDKHPQFWLTIKVKEIKGSRAKQETLARESVLKQVSEVLEAVIWQWLEVNQFSPRKKGRKLAPDGGSYSASSTPTRGSSSTSVKEAPSIGSTTLRPASSIFATSSSRKRKRPALGVVQPQNPAIPYRGSDHFGTWSRIKSSHSAFYDTLWDGKKSSLKAPAATSIPLTPPAKRGVKVQASPFTLPPILPGDLNSRKPVEAATRHPTLNPTGISDVTATFGRAQPPVVSMHQSSDDFGESPFDGTEDAWEAPGQDRVMTWRDPTSKETFLVNARTGAVIPRLPTTNVSFSAKEEAPSGKTLTDFNKPFRLARRPGSSRPQSAQQGSITWLQNFLQEWRNPVFRPQSEESIPSVQVPGLENPCRHDRYNTAFSEHSDNSAIRLDRESLQAAKVIAQVDKKFILIKTHGIPTKQTSAGLEMSRKPTLVLIDQHAASERITLEGLFDEFFLSVYTQSAAFTPLEKPFHFQIPLIEVALFERYANECLRWGLSYSISLSAKKEGQEAHLTVHAVPSLILERCKNEPKLLISLLRSHIHDLNNGAIRPFPVSAQHGSGESKWVHLLPSMPKKMLDLLNSRACRSAIMFNDLLSMDECRQLVSGLAKCVFPFVCAHGRPSLVVLGGLGFAGEGWRELDRGDEGRDGKGGFVEAFKKWRERTEDQTLEPPVLG